jgi:ATP-independent RNA helicase DbpA
VVNFELAWDPEVHVHRIGRTARAGNSGLAISFCAPEEAQRANILSEMLQIKLNWMNAGPASALCRWRPKWRRCALMAVKKPRCVR